MLGEVDRVVAAVGREARQVGGEVGEAGAGRNRERGAEGVREGDAVQLAPAVVVLVGRAGEGGRERGARCQLERVLEAGQDDEVAFGLGRELEVGDVEEAQPRGADAARGRERVEQVAQRHHRLVIFSPES